MSQAELESAEVLARVALHRVHADLGEQITIRQAIDSIEISGVVDSRARKQEIQDALASVPHLVLNVLSAEEIPVTGLREVLSASPASSSDRQTALLAGWLEQHYPDPQDRRVLANQVLSASRDCLRRAYAIDALAKRYPQRKDPEISSMLQDHVVAMQARWRTLENLVSPAVALSSARVATGSGWVESADALLVSTRALDSSLVALFVGNENAAASSGFEASVAGARTQAGAVVSNLEFLAHQFQEIR
jgi:hypothetical protein